MTFNDYVTILRRIMATICCTFGLPGNILTIIVCIKALCHRKINFERKVFDLYLAEISILGKMMISTRVFFSLFLIRQRCLEDICKDDGVKIKQIFSFSMLSNPRQRKSVA